MLDRLRHEQHFVCAVPGCASPYLYWHHFDPPWREAPHHNPDGMVGLCGEHHAKADAGAFTREQLREFKQSASADPAGVSGAFDWLRRDLVLVAGGICFVNTPIAVEVSGRPAIWFRRDDNGYGLLNVRMPQSGPSRRVEITDNFWIATGNVRSLVCPPSGKSLVAEYANGDRLRIEFAEVENASELTRRHPTVAGVDLSFPTTTVTAELRVPELGLSIEPHGVGQVAISGSKVDGCRVGLSVNVRRGRPR